MSGLLPPVLPQVGDIWRVCFSSAPLNKVETAVVLVLRAISYEFYEVLIDGGLGFVPLWAFDDGVKL